MSTRGLLGGEVETGYIGDELDRLRQENQRLSDTLERTIDERNQMRNELRTLQDSVRSIQTQLSPLYRALCGLFGEFDRVSKETDFSGTQTQTTASSPVWDSWKRKLGGKAAEFIDALLLHGEMTGAQLKAFTKCGQQTVYDTIAKLNKAQIINKHGGKFSLKQL